MRAPRPGRWLLDPATAAVAFSGRATRFSPTVAAQFRRVQGCVVAGDGGGRTTVEVEVDVRSMTSGNRAWDDVVAAVDPFGAREHPVAVYRSTAVAWRGARADVDGVLELRGVRRPVRLAVETVLAPSGSRMALRASGEVDREAFGLRFDVPGAALLVPRRLALRIEVEVVHDGALVAA